MNCIDVEKRSAQFSYWLSTMVKVAALWNYYLGCTLKITRTKQRDEDVAALGFGGEPKCKSANFYMVTFFKLR